MSKTEELVRIGRDYACGPGDLKTDRGDYGIFEDFADHIQAQQSLIDELCGLLLQYRDDLIRPPVRDSQERRIKAIDAALARAKGDTE